MTIKELVIKNRSYRRYHQDKEVTEEMLRSLVDLARTTPASRNMQPLRYILSFEAASNADIFKYVAWAGYLPHWGGPIEGERPAAYLVVLADTTLSTSYAFDLGISAQTILLGATEMGLGGCIMGAIQRPELMRALNIPQQYEIGCVIALGYPKEQVVIEPMPASGDVKYWRDAQQVHHVPKRALNDLIVKF